MGPSAGQQRQIPQATCIEDAMQCNECDAMLCYAGNGVVAARKRTTRDRPTDDESGVEWKYPVKIEEQKDQAGLMVEVSKIKSCSGPAQPHSVQLIVSPSPIHARSSSRNPPSPPSFCPFVSETLLPVPSSHWVSKEPITMDIHRLSHRRGRPGDWGARSLLLPTRTPNFSQPPKADVLLCHSAHTCPPTTVGMTTLFALFPPATAASPSVAAGDASLCLTSRRSSPRLVDYVLEESNSLLM